MKQNIDEKASTIIFNYKEQNIFEKGKHNI